jgi:hypothetical protein
MYTKKAVLTRHIGFRVSEEIFQQIQTRADRAEKQAGEWCREKVIEASSRPRVTVPELAILCEVVASQEILVELLYAIVSEGKPTLEKFRQITARAHAAKKKEAWKLIGKTQVYGEANLPTAPAKHSAATAR